MKKTNKLLLASALLVAGSLVSCGGGAPAEKEARIALGYKITWEGYQYNDPLQNKLNNLATFDVAAVAFDKDGKIIDCRFDSQQLYLNYNAEGAKDDEKFSAKNVVDGQVKSKLELGKDYNMHLIGKKPGATLSAAGEVDTQIEAFADFCVGKTVNQVLAAETVPGVTINFDMYTAALQSAANASRTRSYFKYTGDLKVGVGMSNGSMSVEYGVLEASTHFAAAAVVDGKVAASFTDAGVIQLNKTPETVTLGEETGDLFSTLSGSKYLVNKTWTSKYDLHDDYAMLVGSANHGSDLAEWDTQAESFDAFCAGKTATQIANAEEIPGVTIWAGDLVQAVAEAAEYAVVEHVGPQW